MQSPVQRLLTFVAIFCLGACGTAARESNLADSEATSPQRSLVVCTDGASHGARLTIFGTDRAVPTWAQLKITDFVEPYVLANFEVCRSPDIDTTSPDASLTTATCNNVDWVNRWSLVLDASSSSSAYAKIFHNEQLYAELACLELDARN